MSEISRGGASGEVDRSTERVGPRSNGQARVRKPEPSLVATAAWLGLVIGMIEVGVLLVEMYQNRVATIGALRLNRHYPWMIPLAHMALFVAFGLASNYSPRPSPPRPARSPRSCSVLWPSSNFS